MRVYVPSSDRRDAVDNGVMRFASPRLKETITFVVPRGQGELYQRSFRLKGMTVPRILEHDEEGIAPVRYWIGQKAREDGESTFCMMDDDTWFYTRISPDDWKLRYSEHDDVDAMLAEMQRLLEGGEYAHVGVSSREGNNRFGVGGPDFGVDNTRTTRVLGYRTDEFLAMVHCRVRVMEDFDVNLQLLERGLKNRNLIYWAQGQRQTNAPGGCSVWRTHEVHDAAARRLAELHPHVVTLRQKENKSGGAFGKRTEVTVQWKQAYERGVASRMTSA